MSSPVKFVLFGVNNDFFTHNPFKRYNGQLFYAYLIRKTNPIIYKQITGKGYSPEDLLTKTGKYRITKNFVKKRLARRMSKPVLDNFSIMSSLNYNNNNFHRINKFKEYFNTKIISEYLNNTSKIENESVRDNLMKSLSLSYLLSKV